MVSLANASTLPRLHWSRMRPMWGIRGCRRWVLFVPRRYQTGVARVSANRVIAEQLHELLKRPAMPRVTVKVSNLYVDVFCTVCIVLFLVCHSNSITVHKCVNYFPL